MPLDPDGSTTFLDPKARQESRRREEKKKDKTDKIDKKDKKRRSKKDKKDKRRSDKKTSRKHKRKSSRSLSSKETKPFDNDDDASTSTCGSDRPSSPRSSRGARKSTRSLFSSPTPSATEGSCSSERERSTTSVLTDESENTTLMASPVATTTVAAVKLILKSQHPTAPPPAPPSLTPDPSSSAAVVTDNDDNDHNDDDVSVGHSSLAPLPETNPADALEASLTTFQTVSEDYEWVEASVDSHDFFYEEEVIEEDMENENESDSPIMASPTKQQMSAADKELSWVPTPLREKLPRIDVNAAHALAPHTPTTATITTVNLDEEKRNDSALVSPASQHPSPSSVLLVEEETHVSPAAVVVLPEAPLVTNEDDEDFVRSEQVKLDNSDANEETPPQAQLHGINLSDAIASLVSLPAPPESPSDSVNENEENKIIVESPKAEQIKKHLQVIRNPSKEYRVNVAQDAAGIGELTRLREAVVEAVAIEHVEEEEWARKTVLQAQVTRSAYFQCLNEAAALGQVTGHKPIEYCNWSSSDEEFDEFGEDEPVSRVESLKDQLKESQRPQIQRRTSQLVEGFVRETKAEKVESWSAEKVIDEMGITLHAQKAWETEGNDAALPTLTVPKFQKPVSYMTPQRMKDAIARETAEQSLERRYRLEQKRELRMRGKCRCRYCLNPSVFQTQSYARLRSKQNWTDDSMEGEAPEIEQESEPKGSQSLMAVSEHGMMSPPRQRPGFNPRLTSSSKPKKPKSFVSPNELARNEVPSWKKRAAEAKRNLPDASLRTTKSPVKGGLTISGKWISPRKGKSVVSRSTPSSVEPRKNLSLQSSLPPAPVDFCDSPILKAKLRKRDWTTVAKKSPKRDEPKPEWASATFRNLLGTGGVDVHGGSKEGVEETPPRDSTDRGTLLSFSSFAADEEMDEEELLRQQLLTA